MKKHLVTANSGFGQRVAKYEQRFCNSAFGYLKLNSAEVAILTLLFLRAAQTPGELRTRSGRLHDFTEVAEIRWRAWLSVRCWHGCRASRASAKAATAPVRR